VAYSEQAVDSLSLGVKNAFVEAVIEYVPIEVKLIHLPLEFWNSTCLSFVASGIRKPLYADSITEDQGRLGHTRVLVGIRRI
jgi:hypothetical protein